jgi:2-hydroxycyclohexanecarboxyl-CoA dehydrogenase
MRGLKGKTAIVTGGAAGIGAAIVERFRQEGTKVVIFDLNGEKKVDITDYEAVKQAVADAGPVDILVNNAGWDMFKPFLKTDPGFWQKIISINLVGAMNLLHNVLPGMVARGGGKVVNIASDAGRVGSSGEAVYSACKGGIIALTKTLARELATKGVRLNTVCPGLTETNMLTEFMKGAGNPDKLAEAYRRAIPIGRLGKPEDLPGAVLFLSSDDADFITGQVLSVSGGLTMHG